MIIPEKRMELNIDAELELVCHISGGENHALDPGSTREIEDLYVGVIIRGAAIDITHLLSSRQRAHLEEVIWTHDYDQQLESEGL